MLDGLSLAGVVAFNLTLRAALLGLDARFTARPEVRDAYLRAKPLLDRASALALGGLGLRHLWSARA